MNHQSLAELADDPKNAELQEYIPEEYRIKDLPLIWIRNDCYPVIADEDRKDVFNLY